MQKWWYIGAVGLVLCIGSLGWYVGAMYAYRNACSLPETECALAVIVPLEGNRVEGEVMFHKENEGVRVVGEIRHVSPGLHGFHIHMYGDLRCKDGMCAGDHFNPTHTRHGLLSASEHHVGDLGNLDADEHGVARIDLIVAGMELSGVNGIIGRGLVVHADPDDGVTQPSGNSGKRIGLGLIGIAKKRS